MCVCVCGVREIIAILVFVYQNACVFAHVCMCVCTYVCVTYLQCLRCGVASISRLLQILFLLCKRDLSKRLYSAKETYIFCDTGSPLPKEGRLSRKIFYFSSAKEIYQRDYILQKRPIFFAIQGHPYQRKVDFHERSSTKTYAM